MEKTLSILILLLLGTTSQGCEIQMNCTHCTRNACYFVEKATFNFCLEDTSGLRQPVTIVTSPDECPFITSTTTNATNSSSSPTTPLATSKHPPSVDNSCAFILITRVKNGIFILILVIFTVTAIYFFKTDIPVRGHGFHQIVPA